MRLSSRISAVSEMFPSESFGIYFVKLIVHVFTYVYVKRVIYPFDFGTY